MKASWEGSSYMPSIKFPFVIQVSY
jgi:hypothetical protein